MPPLLAGVKTTDTVLSGGVIPGAEVVVRKLIGTAVLKLFLEKFPEIGREAGSGGEDDTGPYAGFLRWFALVPTGQGFTLRFPRRSQPTRLQPMPEYPKLLATFRQYGDWLSRLGISYAGALNDAIAENRAGQVVLVSEALHERRIADIAGQIADRLGQTRLVLIAGPSASGKTTFSKRLAIQLLALGIAPLPIELDNYFVDREATPKDETGQFDYESIGALDLNRLNRDLRTIIAVLNIISELERIGDHAEGIAKLFQQLHAWVMALHFHQDHAVHQTLIRKLGNLLFVHRRSKKQQPVSIMCGGFGDAGNEIKL